MQPRFVGYQQAGHIVRLIGRQRATPGKGYFAAARFLSIDYGVVPVSYATQSVSIILASEARSGLRCPIYNCVYEGLSLTDRI
jgi:hypothetical protein